MRPLGQISTALLSAAGELTYEVGGQRRGPTLQEMAHHAQVGIQAARDAVHNLRRAGKLEPVGERKVDYRNRPVVEYAPKRKAAEGEDQPFFDVASVFATWARG